MDPTPIPRWQRVTGWVLTALPAFVLLSSAANVVLMTPDVAKGFADNGFPESTGPVIGACALVSGLLYLIPQTAVLGAVLVTGYLGGAVATHVRVGDGKAVVPVVMGVIAWLGLYLRDRRVRALMPLRT